METKNEELTLAQKIKIIGTMSLVALAVVAGTAGTVVYQRNAKAEAAALLQKQIAAVMAKKAILPLYRETKEFKDLQGEKMVKVNQSSLPTTITAGLDDTVSPNPICYAVPEVLPGKWSISEVGGDVVATTDTPNGWSYSSGGGVSIPADAAYGKYQVTDSSTTTCSTEAVPSGTLIYYYAFKIVPPCPTVTLTATSTYHSGSGSG